jgi:hypothetical protein
MGMEEVVTMVSQVGFPIVVALYSLIRLETAVKNMTRVLTVISTKIGVEVSDDK